MKPTEIGSNPIEFSLKGVDGKIYSLNDFSEKKYLAIMFSCNHCPYVIASENEFVKIQEDYQKYGFQFIAINSNSANPNYPGDSYDNMVKRAKERSFNFPYLIDEHQKIATLYQAGRTPEIYLYGENRKLVYQGRINDNPKNYSQITRHDFRVALDELISGNEVSVPSLPAIGCSIKYLDD